MMAEESLEVADPLDPFDVTAAQGAARLDEETATATKQAALRARREAYVRVFTDTPIAGDAATVLADLRRFCRGGQTPWADDARVHALLTGRNEVYTRIAQHTQLRFDDLWEIYEGGAT